MSPGLTWKYGYAFMSGYINGLNTKKIIIFWIGECCFISCYKNLLLPQWLICFSQKNIITRGFYSFWRGFPSESCLVGKTPCQNSAIHRFIRCKSKIWDCGKIYPGIFSYILIINILGQIPFLNTINYCRDLMSAVIIFVVFTDPYCGKTFLAKRSSLLATSNPIPIFCVLLFSSR